MNVLNMPGNADEKSTAVATVPVAMYSIVLTWSICLSSVPNPSPNASR